MKINPNDPAMPIQAPCITKGGLSIRAELAARAMQALISSGDMQDAINIAKDAISYADILITELNKTEK